MVASQQALPAGEVTRQGSDRPKARRWKDPNPDDVETRVAVLTQISKHKDRRKQVERLAPHLVQFLLDSTLDWEKRPGDYEVNALAFRSPDLARIVRPTLAAIAREPELYLPQAEGESNTQRRNRITEFRSRAQVEDRLVYRVQAAEAAKRGVFFPEFNARARARRRLAEEHPERFLELVREEEAAQAARNEAERRARARERRADDPQP
ncbi:hypothetical protein ACIQ9R_36370 [Streptomyces sp. NPDC094447]|uniref:hypothetical protein n=1 Tax=Streptomyces sp. NPDC094447 TaxID=3366062 RepID=UPI003830C260